MEVVAVIILILLFLFIVAGLSAWAIEQGQRTRIAYCIHCRRNVIPEKRFNWIVFAFLLGFIYLPFYLTKKPSCPICGSEQFEPPKHD